MRFIVVSFFVGVLNVFSIRDLINELIDYRINKKKRNLKKQGQSLVEAFFFTRFREEIPHWLIKMLVLSVILPFVMLLCGILVYIFCGEVICEFVCCGMMLLDAVPSSLLHLLTHPHHSFAPDSSRLSRTLFKKD